MAYSSDRTQDVEFWRERLRKSPNDPLRAIGIGFDWDLIDDIHRKIISENMSIGDSVLDVACGIGRTSEWFLNYYGIDFVPEFIEIARKKHPTKSFDVCDITKELPFGDKQFDVALLISVKKVIEPVIGEDRWKEVEKELKRVAKKIIILEYGNSDPEQIKRYTEIYG